MEECIGRGACSSVWKARRARSNDPKETFGIAPRNEANGLQSSKIQKLKLNESTTPQNEKSQEFALKIFPMRDHERREMLVRELKLLCSFRCDCLVELEGAFLDSEEGTVTLVSKCCLLSLECFFACYKFIFYCDEIC